MSFSVYTFSDQLQNRTHQFTLDLAQTIELNTYTEAMVANSEYNQTSKNKVSVQDEIVLTLNPSTSVKDLYAVFKNYVNSDPSLKIYIQNSTGHSLVLSYKTVSQNQPKLTIEKLDVLVKDDKKWLRSPGKLEWLKIFDKGLVIKDNRKNGPLIATRESFRVQWGLIIAIPFVFYIFLGVNSLFDPFLGLSFSERLTGFFFIVIKGVALSFILYIPGILISLALPKDLKKTYKYNETDKKLIAFVNYFIEYIKHMNS